MSKSAPYVCAVSSTDAILPYDSVMFPGGVVVLSTYYLPESAVQSSIGIVLTRDQAIDFANSILARCGSITK
jgi:hypothetical protein